MMESPVSEYPAGDSLRTGETVLPDFSHLIRASSLQKCERPLSRKVVTLLNVRVFPI